MIIVEKDKDLIIDSNQLNSWRSKFMTDIKTIEENQKYVSGKNPYILEKLRKDATPDNRVPSPFAKIAVEDLAGYAASPGKLDIIYEGSEKYKEAMSWVKEHNKDNVLNAELYNTACSFGVAYELHYTSDEMSQLTLTPEYTIVDNTEIQIIYDDSPKPKIKAFIRWRNLNENGKTVARVYHPYKVDVYKQGQNGNFYLEKTEDHVYSRPPLAVFRANRERKPIFDAEKTLIDAHDILVSKSLNEVDRFNALIALFPGDVDQEFVDKLNELKLVDNLGNFDKWPEYMEKTLSNIEGFYNSLTDRLERLFHKSVKVPDFTSQDFNSADDSGVSKAFKLLGMEFKAAMIDAFFDSGFLQRFNLINDVVSLETGIDMNDVYFEVKHERNIPINKALIVQMAVQLIGILSKEAVLKMLPSDIVPDVELELERLKNETPEPDNFNI